MESNFVETTESTRSIILYYTLLYSTILYSTILFYSILVANESVLEKGRFPYTVRKFVDLAERILHVFFAFFDRFLLEIVTILIELHSNSMRI